MSTPKLSLWGVFPYLPLRPPGVVFVTTPVSVEPTERVQLPKLGLSRPRVGEERGTLTVQRYDGDRAICLCRCGHVVHRDLRSFVVTRHPACSRRCAATLPRQRHIVRPD